MVEHMHAKEDGERQGSLRPEGTQGIGEQLRVQRKARGISLIEVAEHTKIGKKYLEALEEGRYDLIPGETYLRGFLRAYAKYLEMDDELLLRQYKAETQSQRGERESRQVSDEEEPRKNNQSVWIPLLSLLLLAGVGAGIFLLWPNSPANKEVQPGTVVQVPTAITSNTVLGSQLLKADQDMSLTVKAKEKTWITVMADGRQEPDVTLNAGEEQTWKAKEQFVLWTGNAGGVEVIFNGEVQPPLGKPGEVRKEVVFQRRQPQTTPLPLNPVNPPDRLKP